MSEKAIQTPKDIALWLHPFCTILLRLFINAAGRRKVLQVGSIGAIQVCGWSTDSPPTKYVPSNTRDPGKYVPHQVRGTFGRANGLRWDPGKNIPR